jgi:hypothetical protein
MVFRRSVTAACVCCFWAVAGVSGAQERSVPVLTAARNGEGERPTIDGRVDEGVWAHAQPFSDFVQQDPNEGAPATELTEIRFLLDRGTLYIAVVCFDSEPRNPSPGSSKG